MLEAMSQIGKATLSNELGIAVNEIDALSELQLLPFIVKTPYDAGMLQKEIKEGIPTVKYPRIFSLNFKTATKNTLRFVKVEIMQYSQDIGRRLLLLESSGGSYQSPTFQFSSDKKGKKAARKDEKISKSQETTIAMKGGIEKAIANMVKYLKANKKVPLLQAMLVAIGDQSPDLADQLFNLQMSIFPSPDKAVGTFKSLLTVTVDGKYPGELDEIARPVFDKKFRDFAGEGSNETELICSITGKPSTNITGNYKPYSFYTTDKPGYIAGGFNLDRAIYNCPVSFKTALLVEVGKRILENQLRFRIGAVTCYVIPKAADIEVLKGFIDHYKIDARKTMSTKATLKGLTEDETTIFEYFGGESKQLAFDFVFFSLDTNKVFKFLLYLNDIRPSRIKEIYNAITAANNYDPSLSYFASDMERFPAHFSFRSVMNLCTDDLGNLLQKKFLGFLQTLFLGKLINWPALIRDFFQSYRVIRHNDRSDASDNAILSRTVKDFVPVFLTLKNLHIVSNYIPDKS